MLTKLKLLSQKTDWMNKSKTDQMLTQIRMADQMLTKINLRLIE